MTARAIGHAALADQLTATHPGVVRAVHHPTNLGYGAALRSGFGAARYELVAFTDGDRQFRVADLGRLTERLAGADQPDVVVGYRIKRADPARPDALRPCVPAGQPALLRAHGHRCRLRLQAVPARGAGGRPGRVRRRLLLRGAPDQAAGRRSVGRRGGRPALPAHGRVADRRETPGGLSGRARLLAPAARDVGEPVAGDAPRPADRSTPAADGLARRIGARQLWRSSASGSTSSEFTNSRKTSSRGSTICSPVISRVLPSPSPSSPIPPSAPSPA